MNGAKMCTCSRPMRACPFPLDIDSELTEKDDAMAGVAGILDEAEAFASAARDCLRAALENEENERHETVSFFMRFHLEELEMEEAQVCFGTEDPGALLAFLETRRKNGRARCWIWVFPGKSPMKCWRDDGLRKARNERGARELRHNSAGMGRQAAGAMAAWRRLSVDELYRPWLLVRGSGFFRRLRLSKNQREGQSPFAL